MSRSLDQHAALARARAVPWDEQRARRVARQLALTGAERRRTAGLGIGTLQLLMMGAAGVVLASLLVRIETSVRGEAPARGEDVSESPLDPLPGAREASEGAAGDPDWAPLGDGGLEASVSLEPGSL